MKNTLNIAAIALAMLVSCSEKPEKGPSTGEGTGYADPKGVMFIAQGVRWDENSTLDYIAPDGTFKQDIYGSVNGSSFGNECQDMYIKDGKIYFLSDDFYEVEGQVSDGCLVIADATTMVKEKAFRYEDMTFPRPEGSLDPEENLHMTMPLCNIAVIDERNIFISDSKAMFRFDSTTGEMNILEGSYAFGNQGNTIESIAATRGMTVIGDKLYCGASGFWSSTKLLEFSKDSNTLTREIEFGKGDFISGICRTGEKEIVVGTCGRGGSTTSYLFFIDTETMQITKEKQIRADISAELMNSSGITLCGDYLYFAAGTLTVSRLSLKTWKAEECISISEYAPTAKYLTCNVVADPESQRLYVTVSDEYSESVRSPGNILVFDCSGEKPELIQNIQASSGYRIGIYPVSIFK